MDNKVLTFLKDYNIFSIEDLDNKRELFNSREFMDLFWDIARQDYDRIEKHISYSASQADDKQFFWFENNVVCSENDIVSKYSCVFPQKTIIESGDMALIDIYAENIYIDTYKIAKTNFLYEKILSNNIAYISPRYYDWCDDSFPRGNNVSYIDQIVNQSVNNNSLLNYLFVALPWLYNARVEDYIEISNRYKIEFENYNFELRKIAQSSTTKEEFAKSVIKNIEEININIRIGLDKKKRQLKSKGITTFVGVCFTLIPFVFPETLNFLDDKFLSTVFGGGTVYQGLNLLGDMFDMKYSYSEIPFWIIWKWKETSEKRK